MVNFGEVYWLDLTQHTYPSSSTMKRRHPVVVIQNEHCFSRKYQNVILVPGTTYDAKKYWDFSSASLKHPFHCLLSSSNYSKLAHDTLIKCEQIFTVSSSYLQSFMFNLTDNDMREILKRIALVLGFNRV